MILCMNDIMDVQLRKYNRNIEISGVAIMVFAVWDVLKDVLSVFFGTESLETFLGYSVEDVENGRIILALAFSMAIIVIFAGSFYLGRSAVRYARGEKKSPIFLFWIVVLFISDVTSIPDYFKQSAWQGRQLDDTLASLLLDISFCLLQFDLLYSAVRAHFIKKELKRRQAA